MPPDAGDLASALALLALTALVLPKRDWRSLPTRLRAVAGGERRYVFGPPAGRGVLPLVWRELPRALALGLPLHALTVLVESRAARRRDERRQQWSASAAGLLQRHLTGQLSQADLLAGRRELGLPPPAAKLHWTPPRRFVMPPISLRLEWEQRLMRMRQGSVRAIEPQQAEPERPLFAPSAVAAEAGDAVGLEICTLGGLRIVHLGVDLAPQLVHQPVAAFVWLYLLAREVRRPGERIARAAFADLMFPRLHSNRQRKSLRTRLSDVRLAQPEPVLSRIRVEGEYVGLDLSGCDLDVRRLLELTGRVARTGNDPLSAPELDLVEAALSQSTEEFLPDWEETELRAGCAGSGASQIVEEVREMLAEANLALAWTLASAHLARLQPDHAIPHLEAALRRRPERSELALRLASVYQQAGLTRRAAELRATYGADEVGRSPPLRREASARRA